MMLAELMGKIVSPIVLGIIFFGIITPVSLATRLFRIDELRLNNVRGESIVCSPEDAFHCFMGAEMNFLVVGNCILRKENKTHHGDMEYLTKYTLD